jgi:hypothetical protein
MATRHLVQGHQRSVEQRARRVLLLRAVEAEDRSSLELVDLRNGWKVLRSVLVGDEVEQVKLEIHAALRAE